MAKRTSPRQSRRRDPPDPLAALRRAYDSGDHAGAASLARARIAAHPRDGLAWKVLGAALTALGEHTEALAAKRRAVELRPEDAEAHSNLGNSLREAGDLDAAVVHCRRAIALQPMLDAAHNNLSASLRLLGRLDEAEAAPAPALRSARCSSSACRAPVPRSPSRSWPPIPRSSALAN